MTDNETFNKLINLVKTFDFSYVITEDLDRWKKTVNQEYLIKKQLKQAIEEFGIESTNKLHKVILDTVEHVMLNDLEEKIIDLWFLPYKHKQWYLTPSKESYQPSKYSLYQAAQNKLHDKPSEEIKVNSKGYQ